MGMMKPINDISNPLSKFIFSNKLFELYLDEENKTKSKVGKKYIHYSSRILFLMFIGFYIFSLWSLHLSRYNYSNPYFDYDHFIFGLLATLLYSILIIGVPYLLLNVVNTVIIIIFRKLFWGYENESGR